MNTIKICIVKLFHNPSKVAFITEEHPLFSMSTSIEVTEEYLLELAQARATVTRLEEVLWDQLRAVEKRYSQRDWKQEHTIQCEKRHQRRLIKQDATFSRLQRFQEFDTHGESAISQYLSNNTKDDPMFRRETVIRYREVVENRKLKQVRSSTPEAQAIREARLIKRQAAVGQTTVAPNWLECALSTELE